MIEIDIPRRGKLVLEHAVFDVNGTLALDGRLLPGVAERLAALRSRLALHLLTANTYDRQDAIDALLGFQAVLVAGGAPDKEAYVRALGAEKVVAVGNGAIDATMLAAAALGIAVLGPEGLAVSALNAADVVVPSITDALDLLLTPQRLVATLRR
jgi:soluble P-type ATPase